LKNARFVAADAQTWRRAVTRRVYGGEVALASVRQSAEQPIGELPYRLVVGPQPHSSTPRNSRPLLSADGQRMTICRAPSVLRRPEAIHRREQPTQV